MVAFPEGVLRRVFIGDRDNYGELNQALDELSKAHGVTPSGIAVAWIVRHPANIQVVLGTTNPVVSPNPEPARTYCSPARSGTACSVQRGTSFLEGNVARLPRGKASSGS